MTTVHAPITFFGKTAGRAFTRGFNHEHVHRSITPVHVLHKTAGQAITHRSRKPITTTVHVSHCPFRGRGTNGTKMKAKKKERIDRSSAPPPTQGPDHDRQRRNVTVVDLAHLGVLALLLGPDLNDMSTGGGTNLLPLGIGAGACDGPLLLPGRIPALWARRVKVEITLTPDAHAHLLLPPCRAPSPCQRRPKIDPFSTVEN